MNTSKIHGKAMLINLRVSQWAARKIDRKAANEVANNHGVQSNKGAYYKSLVEGGSLEEIKILVTTARAEDYRRTLPWSDSGPRILSNLGYLDYMQALGAYRQQFEALVGAFVGEYPLLRQEARRMLGTLFDDADYPDISSVSTKFSFDIGVMPLPMGDDFRCDLGTEEVERIRQEIESNTTNAVHQSMTDAFDRVAVVVEAFTDRLADSKTVFRDSLVQNARDLADVLPSLNLSGDPRLTALADRLKSKLCVYEADDLRKDPTARRAAYNEAMTMRKDLLDFFGGAQ